MPVHPCTENNSPGFQWGNQKCYTYKEGDAQGAKDAYLKALQQGNAILKTGWKEK
jgi:hypothetical protein